MSTKGKAAAKKPAKKEGLIETFVLCEQIRPEVGGKMSLMGVFGEEIVLPDFQPPQKNPESGQMTTSGIDLAFYVRVKYRKSEKATVRVIGPSKNPVIEAALEVKPPYSSKSQLCTIILAGRVPFPIPALGKYVFELIYENMIDTKVFTIRTAHEGEEHIFVR